MNVMAVIAACSGLALLILVVYFGQQQRRHWLLLLHVAAGLVLAVGAASMVPVLFGDRSVQTASLAVEYLAWSGLPAMLVLVPVGLLASGRRAR